MPKTICCFAGHSKASYDSNIKNRVLGKCRELIIRFGVNTFWVGHYGEFDSLAANAVRTLKQQYPQIELDLVVAYLTKEMNECPEMYQKKYDNILMAEIPERTPHPYRIIYCNRYMVDNSDYLISYVNYSCGGAAKTLEYALRKKHIKISNFGGLPVGGRQ